MDNRKDNIIEILPKIFKEGKIEAEKLIEDSIKREISEEIIINPNYKNKGNQLYHYDNLESLKVLLDKGYGGKIDLIYIDPPFLTMLDYKVRIEVLNGKELEVIEYVAYSDNWKGGIKEYLEMLFPRLYLMRELLSEEGSIYVHLDYRTVHYVKIVMDFIFGEERFINEIIWSYKTGGVSSKHYSRKHDTILMYSKTEEYIFNPQKEKSYNREFKPYRFKGVKEYEDEIGWHTLVNLRDVWDINVVGRTSGERVGYGTQKPEKLLERIISTSSRKGSIVGDFFGGSGTTAIVAEKLGRQFIIGDKENISSLTTMKRISENQGSTYTLNKKKSAKPIGKLKINSLREEINEYKYRLKINLKKYELDLSSIKLNTKDRKKIKNILSKDSLAIIDYIGLDLDYNGKSPSITFQDYRKKDYYKINSEIELFIDKKLKDKPIYFKAIDIFGNEYIEIIK